MKKFQLPPSDVEFIRNLLRQGSVKWSGRAECLRRARKRVVVKRGKKRQPIYKYYWKCARCEQWYRDISQMEVDHIVEIGPFTGDWNEHIARHFPPQDNLQVLCITCHMKKTLAYNSARTRWQRKK